MKVAVLYSGGKDSNLALFHASRFFNIELLIHLSPKSSESRLYHKIQEDLVKAQSTALNIPILIEKTHDEEKDQINSLYNVLNKAKEIYNIEGIVTGAVRSTYQASRFQKVCYELDLWCFNPLWLIPEDILINELFTNNFEILITRVAVEDGYRFIGKKLDENFINYLKTIHANISGEGGEYETFVTWMPLFKKRIKIIDYKIVKDENSYEMLVTNFTLV